MIVDQVYPCTDSAMELFENRAYMCGISLEKDSGDSEESGDFSSQGNCSFSEPHITFLVSSDVVRDNFVSVPAYLIISVVTRALYIGRDVIRHTLPTEFFLQFMHTLTRVSV